MLFTISNLRNLCFHQNFWFGQLNCVCEIAEHHRFLVKSGNCLIVQFAVASVVSQFYWYICCRFVAVCCSVKLHPARSKAIRSSTYPVSAQLIFDISVCSTILSIALIAINFRRNFFLAWRSEPSHKSDCVGTEPYWTEHRMITAEKDMGNIAVACLSQ